MEIISIKNPKKEIVEKAFKILSEGGLVVYPTETCYGIGADATNPKAISKLLDYKSRREGNPLSVVVSDKDMARKYVKLNDMAENIFDNYLPAPITVVSESLGKVVSDVESELGTLGIRVPDYDLILEISKSFGKPFTATSANMFYKPKPYSVESLLKYISQKKKNLIDLVIDAGELPKGKVSTVVDTTLNTINVLREGKFSFDKSLKDLKLSKRTSSEEQTIDFGNEVILNDISNLKDFCIVFLLSGELGAGKTQFTKGLAQGLNISKLIKSPTYNILNEYEIDKGKFVHIDLWKVYSWEEFLKIGALDCLKNGNVISIEWGDKFFEKLVNEFSKKKAKIFKVSFEYISETERDIKVF